MEEIMAEKENKTIIFVETKRRCDDLTRRMRRDGWLTPPLPPPPFASSEKQKP